MSDKDLGRYQIEKELGRGGMSVVYLALDPHLQRPVAVKVMHPHLASRHDARKRFLQEAKAIARLEHPHVLNVFDYASEEQGSAYIVSEFVNGFTLKDWVNQYGILYCEVAALLSLPIFEALSHAHQHGIIHRDVKPENIMIRKKDSFPILMDFGIAHMADAETLTVTGAVIGSPAHMAPEVVNGDPLTASVDIFSMGTVLYWMICDALPFVAPNPAALFRRILEARFDPIQERKPNVCPSLAQLTEQCMQKLMSDRPQDTKQIVEQLRDLLRTAGLVDIEQELQALAQDPVVYQESLAMRMKDGYIASAEKILQTQDKRKALQCLKRAQNLDAHDVKLNHLIEKIEDSFRNKKNKFTMLLSSFLIGATIIILWNIYTPQYTSTMNTDSIELEMMTDFDKNLTLGPINQNPALFNLWSHSSTPLHSDDQVHPFPFLFAHMPITQDTPEPSKSILKSVQTKVLKNTKKSFKKKFKKKSSSQRRKNKHHKMKAISFQKVLIGSRYKGVNVWLDGKNVGKVYQIERNQGLALSLYQSHKITFKMRHCETVTHKIYLTQKAKVLPRISFECRFKPASFKIIGAKGIEIYLRGRDSRRLGFTNQEIKYNMKTARSKLSLLLVSDQQKDRALQVELLAGEKTQIRL